MNPSSLLRQRYAYAIILLRQLIITDFKLRYQNSVLGYLWSLLKPLALFSILYVVFVRFLPLGKDVPHYPVYLLLGIIIWNFFSELSNLSLRAIVDKGELLRKLNFPRYVLVVSAGASAFINLLLNMFVVVVFMVLSQVDLNWHILFVPLLFLELIMFAGGVGLFLSALFVRFRDLSYIWEVVLQAAFYATPIIYPISRIPNIMYAKLLLLNPMAQIIQDLRYCLVTQHEATIGSLYGTPWIRLLPIGVTLLLPLLALQYFRAQSQHFAEEV